MWRNLVCLGLLGIRKLVQTLLLMVLLDIQGFLKKKKARILFFLSEIVGRKERSHLAKLKCSVALTREHPKVCHKEDHHDYLVYSSFGA